MVDAVVVSSWSFFKRLDGAGGGHFPRILAKFETWLTCSKEILNKEWQWPCQPEMGPLGRQWIYCIFLDSPIFFTFLLKNLCKKKSFFASRRWTFKQFWLCTFFTFLWENLGKWKLSLHQEQELILLGQNRLNEFGANLLYRLGGKVVIY